MKEKNGLKPSLIVFNIDKFINKQNLTKDISCSYQFQYPAYTTDHGSQKAKIWPF